VTVVNRSQNSISDKAVLLLPEYVSCDLCGNDNYGVIWPETVRRTLADSDFTVFGEQGEYPRLVRCRRCRLVYANPRDSAELQDKYRELDINNYLLEEHSRRKTCRSNVSFLKKYLAGGRVLDIGCSAGLFLSCLPEEFEPHGVEPCIQGFLQAQKLLGENAVQCSTFETSDHPETFFDVVTMWDVIEHLPSPRLSLLKVARLLKKWGLVILVTPDFGSLTARLWSRRWPHLIRQHIYYFEETTLRILLGQCGFEMIYKGTYTRHFTLRYLAQRIRLFSPESGAIFGKPGDCKSALWNLCIPVNLRDFLLVVARKSARD